ncbi:unnamed protein product [Amoebophrya sp. A25]|nr:unnamed protein product [Amoebophrya sp. A25]|eukprot:GSA25T00016942001.1
MCAAVAFLHQSGRAHQNFDLGSVFQTESGDCRLSGFELCSTAGGSSIGSVLDKRRETPQLRENSLLNIFDIREGGLSGEKLDLIGVDVFLKHVFRSSGLPSSLGVTLQDLLSRPVNNAAVKRLADCSYFQEHPVVRVMSYLENLHIKEPHDKAEFFDRLPAELDLVRTGPERSTLFPLMLPHLLQTHQQFEQFRPALFPSLLKIGTELADDHVSQDDEGQTGTSSADAGMSKTLSQSSGGGTTTPSSSANDSLFREQIVPYLLDQFKVPDRAVRYKLLQALPLFLPKLDENTIQTKIFPDVQNGFSDQNASIREATIKAMVLLAERLDKALVQDKVAKLLQGRLRDPEGPLRTNAVICFGKLANRFQDAAGVLKPVFTSMLADAFVPCRIATLQAIRAVAGSADEIFTFQDLAGILLPSVSQRIAMESEPTVIDTGIQVLRDLTGILAQKRQKQQEQEPSSGLDGATMSSTSASSTFKHNLESNKGSAEPSSAASSSSWGTWAFSKLEMMQGSMASSSSTGGGGSTPSSIQHPQASIGPPPPTGTGAGAKQPPPPPDQQQGRGAHMSTSPPSPAAQSAAVMLNASIGARNSPKSGSGASSFKVPSLGGRGASRNPIPKSIFDKNPRSPAGAGGWDDDDEDLFAELNGGEKKVESKPPHMLSMMNTEGGGGMTTSSSSSFTPFGSSGSGTTGGGMKIGGASTSGTSTFSNSGMNAGGGGPTQQQQFLFPAFSTSTASASTSTTSSPIKQSQGATEKTAPPVAQSVKSQPTTTPAQQTAAMFAPLKREQKKTPTTVLAASELKQSAEDAFWDEFED